MKIVYQNRKSSKFSPSFHPLLFGTVSVRGVELQHVIWAGKSMFNSKLTIQNSVFARNVRSWLWHAADSADQLSFQIRGSISNAWPAARWTKPRVAFHLIATIRAGLKFQPRSAFGTAIERWWNFWFAIRAGRLQSHNSRGSCRLISQPPCLNEWKQQIANSSTTHGSLLFIYALNPNR